MGIAALNHILQKPTQTKPINGVSVIDNLSAKAIPLASGELI
jgi:hypothetical protein